MCGCLAAGMLQAGTRPDNARPAEEDGSRLWLPVMRPAEGAEVEKNEPPEGGWVCHHFFGTSGPYSFIHRGRIALWCL